MAWNFTINALLTIALVGMPTIAHWLWTKRKATLSFSYFRVQPLMIKWFGMIFALLGMMFLTFAALSVFDIASFGYYPMWSLPIIVAMIGLGIGIYTGSRAWLRCRPDYHL